MDRSAKIFNFQKNNSEALSEIHALMLYESQEAVFLAEEVTNEAAKLLKNSKKLFAELLIQNTLMKESIKNLETKNTASNDFEQALFDIVNKRKNLKTQPESTISPESVAQATSEKREITPQDEKIMEPSFEKIKQDTDAVIDETYENAENVEAEFNEFLGMIDNIPKRADEIANSATSSQETIDSTPTPPKKTISPDNAAQVAAEKGGITPQDEKKARKFFINFFTKNKKQQDEQK